MKNKQKKRRCCVRIAIALLCMMSIFASLVIPAGAEENDSQWYIDPVEVTDGLLLTIGKDLKHRSGASFYYRFVGYGSVRFSGDDYHPRWTDNWTGNIELIFDDESIHFSLENINGERPKRWRSYTQPHWNNFGTDEVIFEQMHIDFQTVTIYVTMADSIQRRIDGDFCGVQDLMADLKDDVTGTDFVCGFIHYRQILEYYTKLGYRLGEKNAFSSSAYKSQLQESYDNGKAAGYENGYITGYAAGESVHVDDYKNGFSAGQTDAMNGTHTLKDMVFAIFSAPSDLINGILDFDLFGINLATLVKTLITLSVTALIVVFLIKLMRR